MGRAGGPVKLVLAGRDIIDWAALVFRHRLQRIALVRGPLR